ncbi:MAG: hypothetical protein WB627_05565 [Candidatus Acidiferrum sp.]
MLQLISGAIIAMLVAIWVEYLRRPKLRLIVEAHPCDMRYENRPAKEWRGVRLKLYNEPLPSWAPWMTRSPALQCRGIISFHHLDGQNVFGRLMVARWSNSLEPVPIPIVNADGTQSQILDFGRLSPESRMDVYPGESELLDIAVRLDDDEECYGWNNASYFCTPLWRNKEWRLPPGRYLVKVTITSSGQKCVRVFRLINDISRTDFRLESTTENSKNLN